MISTHTPLARRDVNLVNDDMIVEISTHTPLARRDKIQPTVLTPGIDFYSHASRKA